MHFLLIALAFVVTFALGVYFAPVIRGDYAEFKAYVEDKLKLAEQKAKAGFIAKINKL